LSELQKGYNGPYGIELLVMNGEDYYGANGELLYLEHNEGQLGNIRLFINLDAPGYVKGDTAYSFYNLLEHDLALLRKQLTLHNGLVEGEAWYQSDHAIFVMKGIPAMAVTTENFVEITRKYTHTPRDVPALVDIEKLVQAALAIKAMIGVLSPD
jgi:aminopeptidase YwaD